ncbi:MAG: hypothetical protein NT086_11180 [Proteobacteria bacterium]|nr:hypothetical protein [Pseudomonadota bacterium]
MDKQRFAEEMGRVFNPLPELLRMAALLPPIPPQVHAAVYPLCLNAVPHVVIGAVFDFAPPLSKQVCVTLPIAHLRSEYGGLQIDAWEKQIAILEEQVKLQALQRDMRGHLQSTCSEVLVLNGPWQASHDSVDELLERQMEMRTASNTK